MSAFSLYVHIPYCRVKCPYCDFNVYATKQRPETAYVDALVAELEHYANAVEWKGRELRTIYLGGGTPSLFTSDSIARIVGTTLGLWSADTNSLREVTLEANPGTITVDSLRAYRASGVSRLSMGVQSFQPALLQQLGRDHTADEARQAVDMAREAGFDNVSLDLIFAVPGQSVADWESDLREAIALGTEHVSAYNLTYEEGTGLYRQREKGRVRPILDDDEATMFTRAEEILNAAGYEHYEVSNYTRPGFGSHHNLNYWMYGDYLGIGAGAHSFVNGHRWSNERLPTRYMAAIQQNGEARGWEEQLTSEQARGEFVFLGLRRKAGFSASEFSYRFSVEFDEVFPVVGKFSVEGLLIRSDDRWHLTARGLLLGDAVFAEFL